MATRKRTSSRSRPSGLVGRAVRAGRNALREAESRVPPDLRRQLERTVKDGQKTLKAAIDQLQAQVRSRAKQADVDKVLKRLDTLSKQVQQMASGTSSRGTRRAASTTRRAKAATPKRAARTTTRKAPVARKPATRKASTTTTRRAAPRRASTRRASSAPAASSTPEPTSEPSWMPESNDSGGTST